MASICSYDILLTDKFKPLANGGATDRRDPAGRLRSLQANAELYQEIVPQLHRAAPNAHLLVVTDRKHWLERAHLPQRMPKAD